MSTTTQPNMTAIKKIGADPKFREIVKAVTDASKFATRVRAKVDAYAVPMFIDFAFVSDAIDGNKPLTDPKQAYLSKDEGKFAQYMDALHQAHIDNGFNFATAEVGICPALTAEYDLSKAEQVLLKYMETELGMPEWQTLEDRTKMLALYLNFPLK